MEFPTLYGESSHKKRKVWHIEVHEREDGAGVIATTHGYEDGKMVTTEKVVAAGKNIGKKNETTPVAQAISEARATWSKKRDAGYSAESSVTSALPTPGLSFLSPLPMLAHDFSKRGKSIKFPCLAQRKLDGVRCVAAQGHGLFSRNGKPMSSHLVHIRDAVDTLPPGTILDGELYSDACSFQEVVGLVKKEKLSEADVPKLASIYLCVYDVVCTDGRTNLERLERLQTLMRAVPMGAPLRLLETVECGSLEDVRTLHAAYVAEGYEGLILRNRAGVYAVGHRSADLQKFKEFQDDEYVVVDFKEGTGLETGCVIWICQTADGSQQFAVRPRGSHEERQAAYRSAAVRVGQHLTVRFQELTDGGVPRFPVGISFRDYE